MNISNTHTARHTGIVNDTFTHCTTDTMVSPRIQELVEQLNGVSTEDTGSPSFSDSSASDDTYSPEPERAITAPEQCFGLKWNKAKGLTLCNKGCRGAFRYAFCGKAHKDAFENAVGYTLRELFYALIALTNKHTHAQVRFVNEVVPFFILTSAVKSRHPQGPLQLCFTNTADAFMFDTSIRHETVANVRKFYFDFKDELRRFLADTFVSTGAGTPSDQINAWDKVLTDFPEAKFDGLFLRYLIDCDL